MIHTIQMQTQKRDQMIDVTAQVKEILAQEKVEEGLMVVYSPHTTAGITVNENADPDVQRDFLRRLDQVYPWEQAGDRHIEGNSAAHLKASTVGPSQTLIIENRKLLLGQWQGVYFCEFDGPRSRTCYIKIIRE